MSSSLATSYKLATAFCSPQIQQYITIKVLQKLKTIKKNNIHLIFLSLIYKQSLINSINH